MTSPFDSRCAAIGAPTGLRFNGESVVVITHGGTRKSATAILDAEEPLRDTELERPTQRQVKARFAASDRASLVPDERTPLKVEAQGLTWYVVDVSPDEGGMFEMFLQNELSNQSMAVDLEGNQHEYG